MSLADARYTGFVFAFACCVLACGAESPGAGPDLNVVATPTTVVKPDLDCSECSVVLVTFDGLRADHLGAYGYAKDTSPRLDAFSKEAHVFTDVLSQSGTTLSSLPSIFTSKFPASDGIMSYTSQDFGLKDESLTLGEILKSHGLATGACVAYELARRDYGLSQGFDRFDYDYVYHEQAAATLARGFEVLESLASPFFFWIHFRQPHHPYDAIDEAFDRFYQPAGDEPTVQRQKRERVHKYFTARGEESQRYAFAGGHRKLTSTMVRQYVARYDGNILRGDEAFGQLVDHLEKTGRLENTIVIVGADHGESLGEHRIFDHNALYHGILHVPLLLRLPDGSHSVRDQPAMNVDILPTVLRLLGIEYPASFRGRDLFASDRDDYVQFAEYAMRQTVKQGRYRYQAMEKGPPLLFDVFEDPDEENNLAAAEPELVRALSQRLEELGPRAKTEPLMERLRAIGYIE